MQFRLFFETELRFLFRNATTRNLMYAYVALLFNAALSNYFNEYSSAEKFIFLFLLIGCMPGYYAHHFFSWQLSFLPAYFVVPVNWKAYLSARILVIRLFIVACSIIPISIWCSLEEWLTILSMLFYLLSIIPLSTFIKGTRKVTKTDPNKTALFRTYLSYNKYMMLVDLVVFGIPILMYVLQINYNGNNWIHFYMILAGILSFCLLPFKLKSITRSRNWIYSLNMVN